MVIFYLFVMETSQLTNFLVIVFFSVMTFVPLKYLHPFRVKEKKSLNLFMTFIWGLCCVFLLLDLREQPTQLSVYRDIYYWLWVGLNLYFVYISLHRSLPKNLSS